MRKSSNSIVFKIYLKFEFHQKISDAKLSGNLNITRAVELGATVNLAIFRPSKPPCFFIFTPAIAITGKERRNINFD